MYLPYGTELPKGNPAYEAYKQHTRAINDVYSMRCSITRQFQLKREVHTLGMAILINSIKRFIDL